MLNNPTPSVPANKVSNYKLSNYQVKLYSKILVQPDKLPPNVFQIMKCWVIGHSLCIDYVSIHF